MHDAHVKYEDLFIIYSDVITYWISYEAETSPVETRCKTTKESTGATNRSGQAAKPVQEEKVEEDGAMAALMRLQQLAIIIGWGRSTLDLLEPHWHPLKFTTQPEKNVAGRLFLYLENGLWECIKVFGLSQLDEHIEHPPTITSWPTKIFYKYLYIIIYMCVCKEEAPKIWIMQHGSWWGDLLGCWGDHLGSLYQIWIMPVPQLQSNRDYGRIWMDHSFYGSIWLQPVVHIRHLLIARYFWRNPSFYRVLYPALLQPRTLINCCLYPEGSSLVHCNTRLAHFGVIHIPCCDPGGAQPSQEPEEDTGGSAPGGASGSGCGARASGAAPGGASAGRLPGGADAEIAISIGQIYGKINMGQPSRFP